MVDFWVELKSTSSHLVELINLGKLIKLRVGRVILME
ncbi:hypothetical protein B6N60_05184 [Richelia sinica FACHB-800]|uniref:Uncharacterized protein n=1 Tax=Richelia sinica FACHB-800 TaxID=1357546 RepID=A0A975TD29_9NOST|nr:hypothetical protein B6N60_05184 [Richelia sinica FACHB-800]